MSRCSLVLRFKDEVDAGEWEWLMPESASVLERVGPQVAHEPKLLRRLRFHQSWYRSEVLNRPDFGRTPGERGRALGSILSETDALGGLNFTSPSARLLYEARRQLGWGVDPVRCTSYLTSSQALTLNLFGPLALRPEWCRRFLSRVLRREDIEQVENIQVEWAPERPSEFLRDKTRIDVLVTLRSQSAIEVVVIEVKYGDRFDSRRVEIGGAPYERLSENFELWANTDLLDLQVNCNQLARCDALGMAWAASLSEDARPPTVLVIHHPLDDRATVAVDKYRRRVANPDRVRALSLHVALDELQALAEGRAQEFAAARVIERYGSEALSEPSWDELRARHVVSLNDDLERRAGLSIASRDSKVRRT